MSFITKRRLAGLVSASAMIATFGPLVDLGSATPFQGRPSPFDAYCRN